MQIPRSARLALVLAIASIRAMAAQTGATLTGRVVDSAGHGIPEVLVRAPRASTQTDARGAYTLSVERGRVSVRTLRVGFESRDTTVMSRPGERIRWSPVLHASPLYPSAHAIAAAESLNLRNGRVDSAAGGLLHLDSARVFSYRTFGSRVFLTMARERGSDSNTVLSPASAGIVLSLAAAGARGATEHAMLQTLGANHLTSGELARRDSMLIASMRGRSDVTLSIANGIWVDTLARLLPEFQRLAQREYGAAVQVLPLASPAAVQRINEWASTATHGRISQVLGDPLPRDARLFLANAVYFKGRWLDAFDTSRTRTRPFTMTSGPRISVPMMQRTGHYLYRSDSGFSLLRVPYRGGRFAMYIALPDSGIDPNALASRLEDGWPALRAGLVTREVHLVLPRFHVEQQLDLKPTLEALGMSPAFDDAAADFRGMATADAPLAIGAAAQTVFIDVNEMGAEAAAVTGLTVVPTSLGPPPIEFVIDRPFVFLLRDDATGTDLFVGRIAHP